MQRFMGHTRVIVAVLTAVGTLAIAAPASATHIKGHQIPITNSKYRMKGGLIGTWRVTKFKVDRAAPVFRGHGRETFNGCVDTDRDKSCADELSGKVFFRFRYWARFTNDDQILLGTCAHRVVGGTGGLSGASGFLMMVDTPSAGGVSTFYEGEIDTVSQRGATPAPRC